MSKPQLYQQISIMHEITDQEGSLLFGAIFSTVLLFMSSCEYASYMTEHQTHHENNHPTNQQHLQAAPTPPAVVQIPAKPTNWLAILGLSFAIIGWLLPAIILSILGYRKSKQTGTGRGLAIAGQIIVGCWLAFILLAITVAIIDDTRPHPLKTVQPPTGLYTIQLDDSMSKMDTKDSLREDLGYESIFTEEYILTSTISRKDYAKDVTTQDYGVSLVQSLGELMENPQIKYSNQFVGPNNPHNYDIFDARVSGTIKKVNIIYYIRIIGDGENFYALKTWTVPSKEENARPKLYKTIESFRLTNTII